MLKESLTTEDYKYNLIFHSSTENLWTQTQPVETQIREMTVTKENTQNNKYIQQ